MSWQIKHTKSPLPKKKKQSRKRLNKHRKQSRRRLNKHRNLEGIQKITGKQGTLDVSWWEDGIQKIIGKQGTLDVVLQYWMYFGQKRAYFNIGYVMIRGRHTLILDVFWPDEVMIQYWTYHDQRRPYFNFACIMVRGRYT